MSLKYRSKRKKIGLTILLIVLLLLAAAAICLGGAVFHTLGKMQKVDTKNVEKVDPANETFETDGETTDPTLQHLNPEDIVWNGADTEVMKNKDVANILLIGQDRREGQERQRSDSMILVTLNKKDKTASLTSFMRDMYVQIPGYSDNKMNAAYAFGGMELLDSVIETNFGIHVDGNVEVDFSGFKQIIDIVGGVDITLSAEEAAYLNERGNWDDNDASAGTWSLQEGVNHLTGEQALAYSRIRYIGNADYERTQRQRTVLTAVFEKMKGADAATLVSLISNTMPLLTTDLSYGECLGYAMNAVTLNITQLESYRIPADGTYTPAVINEMQVLVPDLAANQAFLKQNLYGE